jgi:hypothetical protein
MRHTPWYVNVNAACGVPGKQVICRVEQRVKDQIEQALKVLNGLPLQQAGRAIDMEIFHFGDLQPILGRRGTAMVGDYRLHVQCAWRIVGDAGIVVASRDRYYPAGDPYSNQDGFDWSAQGVNRCDERVTAFFKEQDGIHLRVEAVFADNVGSVRLQLSGGFLLDIFPDDSLDKEHWRLVPRAPAIPHFVVTGQGIEE